MRWSREGRSSTSASPRAHAAATTRWRGDSAYAAEAMAAADGCTRRAARPRDGGVRLVEVRGVLLAEQRGVVAAAGELRPVAGLADADAADAAGAAGAGSGPLLMDGGASLGLLLLLPAALAGGEPAAPAARAWALAAGCSGVCGGSTAAAAPAAAAAATGDAPAMVGDAGAVPDARERTMRVPATPGATTRGDTTWAAAAGDAGCAEADGDERSGMTAPHAAEVTTEAGAGIRELVAGAATGFARPPGAGAGPLRITWDRSRAGASANDMAPIKALLCSAALWTLASARSGA